MRAMILVTLDDLLRRFGETGPPAFDLDVRRQQGLPLLVDGPLDYPDDQAEGSVLFPPGTSNVQTEQCFPPARTRFPEGVAAMARATQPGLSCRRGFPLTM